MISSAALASCGVPSSRADEKNVSVGGTRIASGDACLQASKTKASVQLSNRIPQMGATCRVGTMHQAESEVVDFMSERCVEQGLMR